MNWNKCNTYLSKYKLYNFFFLPIYCSCYIMKKQTAKKPCSANGMVSKIHYSILNWKYTLISNKNNGQHSTKQVSGREWMLCIVFHVLENVTQSRCYHCRILRTWQNKLVAIYSFFLYFSHLFFRRSATKVNWRQLSFIAAIN